jgi:hypothetical protein
MPEIEREATRSHSGENLLWMRLWPCHKTDYSIWQVLNFICDWVIAHAVHDCVRQASASQNTVMKKFPIISIY